MFAEGEDERALRAAQSMLEDSIDAPVLLGRREIIEARAEAAGIPMNLQEFEIVNPEDYVNYDEYWAATTS